VPALRTESWLCGNVTGLFGVLSVFGRRIKGMHVHTCSGRNRINPFDVTAKYRQHIEQARNVTA